MPVNISHFMYGNSLVNFAGGSAQSNIPYWFDQLAEASGSTYAANGGFGFLRQFADREEPQNGWGFAGVDGLWDDDFQSFSDVSFDAVSITPANFIQYQAPDQNYEGDTRSPLDATVDVVRDTLADQPDARLYIYEGWSDLGSGFGYPVSPAQLEEYHAYNAGEYHDWFVDYVAQVNAAVPEADVQLIPVASVLAGLFQEGPLSNLTLDELYVDDAPHGTETVYLLASMVSYPAIFGEPLPASFDVPDTIHPALADNYDEVALQISTALGLDGTAPPPPVAEINVDPDADPDTETLNQDEAAIIDVLANDSDSDGDPLTLVSVGPAAFGEVSIVGGQAVYMPDAGYAGTDSFTYEVSDGQGGTATGQVTLNIVAADPVVPDPVPAPPTEPDTDPDVIPDDDGQLVDGFSARYFSVSETTLNLSQIDFSAEPDATGTIDSLQYLETFEAFASETGADYFAAQYVTTLTVTEAGSHELFMVADDDARIYLDGELVLDTQGREAGDQTTARLNLTEGTHQIEVQYLEVSGEQSLSLDWIGPSTGNAFAPLAGTIPVGAEPDPVVPDPVEPDPVEPDPVVPDPVVPDPVEPDPVEPDPIVPDPVVPDPVVPDPVEPDPVEPDPVVPEPTAKTDFGAKAFATSQSSLSGVNFRQAGDVEASVKGITLASNDAELLEGGPDDGAVQFTSSVAVENSGLYRVQLTSDDQASVSISGLPIVSTDASDAGAEQSGSVFLIAGTHFFDVRYLDTGGDQTLDVTWSGPDTQGEVLPLGDAFDPMADLLGASSAAQDDETLAALMLEENDAQTGDSALLLG